MTISDIATLRRPKPQIALLAAPETSPAILFGLFDVLSSVGAVYPDMTTGEPGDALLDIVIVAATSEPFRAFGGVLVEPGASIGDVGVVDVAIMCDLYTPIDVAPRGRFPAEVAWLRRMHSAGALVASVCSGSLLLAEAGLVDGRRCAGHWAYADLFALAYPNVRFDTRAVLVLDGEPDGVITAGGVTAWHDLVLHLITRLCGPEHAVRTAKVHLLAGHEDGQGPYTVMGQRIQQGDAAINRCQTWIGEHYAGPNPVSGMAERSGLAQRTFARRFRSATGYRPIDYVHAIRVNEAKRLLETGGEGIDEVGSLVGYEDPTFFRRLFKRETGMTPAAYRRKFARITTGAMRYG